MRQKEISAGIIPALFIALCIFVACERSQPQTGDTPQPDSTLRFDVPLPFGSFHPVHSVNTGGAWVLPLVHSTLVALDPAGQLEPDLAQGWKYDADTFTWHIDLRRDATFHDGTLVTGKDVVFTIEKSLAKAFPNIFGTIRKIALIKPNSLKIFLKNDHPDFLLQIQSMSILPSHVPLAAHEYRPIGAGPYQFIRKIDDRRIVLSAYDRFYKGRPKIERILVEYIPDKEESWARLIAGVTDIATQIAPRNYKMMAHIKSNYLINEYVPDNCWILLYNTVDPILSDVRVRRALSLGIDRDHIVNQILMGYGQVFGSRMDLIWFNEQTKGGKYTYSPDESQRLLAEGGWQKSKSNGIYYRNGKPLEFSLLYLIDSPVILQVVQFIKISLCQLGVKVSVKAVDYQSLKKSILYNDDFQVAITEIGTWSEEKSIDSFIDQWASITGKCARLGNLKCSELTTLQHDLKIPKKTKDNKAIQREFMNRLSALHPASFLFQKTDVDVVSKRVQMPYRFKVTVQDLHRLYLATIVSDTQ